MVAKRPPLRLGRLLRQGGETRGSVRANVSASAGGLTAWAAVVRRWSTPRSALGSGVAEPLAPIRGDPPTPPLDKGRLGAGGGCMLLRSGPQY